MLNPLFFTNLQTNLVSITFEKPVFIFPHLWYINWTNDRLNTRKFWIDVY